MGSIGTRHAGHVKALYPGFEMLALRARGGAPNSLGIAETSSWAEALAFKPDAALITNPTHLHIKTALGLAREGVNLFIEKPVDLTDEALDELLGAVNEKGLTAYVAYCLRFHPVISALHSELRGQRVLHANIRCTSYLPHWRPNQNTHQTYSAHRAMGGGVILDLSHEFDYAWHLMGPIESTEGRAGRASDVTVDAEDWADALLVHHGGHVTNLHLNFMSLQRQRTIEIDTDEGFFRGDLIRNTLEHSTADNTDTRHFTDDTDEMYRTQLQHFFSNIGNPLLMNNLNEAAPIFRMLLDLRHKVMA